MATVYVNDQWSGKVAGDKVSVNGVEYTIGTDAFASVNEAHAAVLPTGDKLVVIEGSNAVYDHGGKYFYLNAESETDEVIDASETYDLDIDGTLSAYQIILNNAETNVSATGKIRSTHEDLRVLGGSLMVQGTRADGEELVGTDLSDNIWQSRLVPTDKAQISTGYLSVMDGASAEFNDTGVLIHAGSFRIKEFGMAEFYNSVISIGNASTYGGSTISVTDGGLLWLCDHSAIYRGENIYTTADVITLSIGEGANVTVDASSFIQIDAITIAEGGALVIDAAQMYKDGEWVDTYTGGTIKVVDLNMSSALSADQVQLVTEEGQENVKMVFGKDGDIYLTDADTSTIYVNPEYANSTSPDLGDGKVLGVNAFATVHQAINAATDKTSRIEVVAGNAALGKSVTTANPDGLVIDMGNNGVTVNINSEIVDAYGNDPSVFSYITDGAAIGSGVTVNADIFYTMNSGQSAQIDGVVNVNGAGIQSGQVVIGESGELNVRDLVTLTAGGSELVVEGKFTASEVHFHDNTFGSAFTVANGGVAEVADLMIFAAGSEVNVEDGGKLIVKNVLANSIDIAQGGTLSMNTESKVNVDNFAGSGSIIIDSTNFTGTKKLLDAENSDFEGDVTVIGNDAMAVKIGADGDVIITDATTEAIYVNEAWAGKDFGTEVESKVVVDVNAFADIDDAVKAATAETGSITVAKGSSATLHVDVTTANEAGLLVDMGNNNLSFDANGAYTVNGSTEFDRDSAVGAEIGFDVENMTIGANVTVKGDVLWGIGTGTFTLDGTLFVNGVYSMEQHNIVVGGELNVADNLVIAAAGYTQDGLTVLAGGAFNVKNIYSKAASYNMDIQGSAAVDMFDAQGSVQVSGTLTISDYAKIGNLTIAEGGAMTLDAADVASTKLLLDVDTIANAGTITVENLEDGMFTMTAADGDIWVVSNTIYVDANFTGYKFGEAITGTEGLYYGVNAFASLDSISAAASQGVRTIKYTADKSGALEIGISSVAGRTDYVINDIGRYVSSGKAATETVAVTDGKEYTFLFTNESADFDLTATFTDANESEEINLGTPGTNATFADGGTVSKALGAQEFVFTTTGTADLSFTLALTNDGKVEYTLLDSSKNTVLHGYSGSAIRRKAEELAAGTYTLVVESLNGKNAEFTVDGTIEYKVTGPADDSYVNNTDNTIETAAKFTAGSVLEGWVGDMGGAVVDGIDFINVTEAIQDGRNYFSITATGNAKATIWTLSSRGTWVDQLHWDITDETDTRSLRCSADKQYFISIESDNDSRYTMQLS